MLYVSSVILYIVQCFVIILLYLECVNIVL